MSQPLEEALQQTLDEWNRQGLTRRLSPVTASQGITLEWEGQKLINFGSNDYLGLAQHPALREAALRAIREWGTGSTASRLVCGSLHIHHELEEGLAALKGTEAALSFASGYTTALGIIPALVEPGDIVILDRLAHACLLDGARLSRATLRVYRHNDLEDLERLLRWADARRSAAPRTPRPTRILIVTESVFSMDGDRAPLASIVELKERYGAWLMVDEAHATGLFGTRGEGLIGAAGLTERVEIQMGTLGKALGSAGGFIAGSKRLKEWLAQSARSFMFSTAPPPAQAAAAAAAVALLQSPEGAHLRQQLWSHVHRVIASDPGHPLPWPGWMRPLASAILPWLVGDNERALACAQAARRFGLYIPAIRYPAVPRQRARLRITLSAAHRPEDLDRLLSFLHSLGSAPGPDGATPSD